MFIFVVLIPGLIALYLGSWSTSMAALQDVKRGRRFSSKKLVAFCLPFDINVVFRGIYLYAHFPFPSDRKDLETWWHFNFPSTIKVPSSETVQIKIWVIAFRCFRFLACLCHQRQMIYSQCFYYHLGLLSSDPQELLRGGGELSEHILIFILETTGKKSWIRPWLGSVV